MSADYSDVPQHKNVREIDYFKFISGKTVWYCINNYSQLTNSNNPNYFGQRRSDHTMNFYPNVYPGLQEQYNKFLKEAEAIKGLTDTQRADSANAKMVRWFQNEWHDGDAKIEPAQTRAASSYGLLQMMYTTACERGYKKNALPGDLNKISQFDSWLNYQRKLLGENDTKNNWDLGFEVNIKQKILKKWNPGKKGYPEEILLNSTSFLPQD